MSKKARDRKCARRYYKSIVKIFFNYGTQVMEADRKFLDWLAQADLFDEPPPSDQPQYEYRRNNPDEPYMTAHLVKK